MSAVAGRGGRVSDMPGERWPDDPGERAARRVSMAGLFATELCDLPVGVWRSRASGAARSVRSRVDDDPLLADVVAELWDVARSRPVSDRVWSGTGAGGAVVVVHGPTWSVVARSGGPMLVVCEGFAVARIENDPDWAVELAVLTSELINAAAGLPPFDESSVQGWPRLPWHRDPPG